MHFFNVSQVFTSTHTFHTSKGVLSFPEYSHRIACLRLLRKGEVDFEQCKNFQHRLGMAIIPNNFLMDEMPVGLEWKQCFKAETETFLIEKYGSFDSVSYSVG